MKFVWTLLFVCAIGVGLSSSANAASLYGKVVEVSEGDSIAIFNLNRAVRVRLLGIDAPEMKQRFGDVSRQHLSDLVFDKFVTVEYSGISNGLIVGKVVLDKTDVCAQMVRDGAAWFDGNQRHVGELEGQVYQQSESAARQERRGIWQDESPVAPWEFVRAEIERRKPVVATTTVNNEPTVKKASLGGLTNESVRFAGLPARNLRLPKPDGAGEIKWSNDSPDEPWKTMRPTGEFLSAYAPADGQHVVVDIPWGDQTVDAHYYVAKDEGTIYEVAWASGPTFGESDEEVLKNTFYQLLKGVDEGFESSAGPASFSCRAKQSSPLTMNGYTGREFDLSGCTVPGVARMYTAVTGESRRIYFTLAFHKPTKESGDAMTFVRSLKVGAAVKTNTPKKK